MGEGEVVWEDVVRWRAEERAADRWATEPITLEELVRVVVVWGKEEVRGRL